MFWDTHEIVAAIVEAQSVNRASLDIRTQIPPAPAEAGRRFHPVRTPG